MIVHCKTQNQWDQVREKSRVRSISSSTWNTYKSSSCIDVNADEWCNVEWYRHNRPTLPIIPAEEYLGDRLPQRWYVHPRTRENLELIKRYFPKYERYHISASTNTYTSDGEYFYTKEAFVKSKGIQDYVEITMEQFKKYVLKQDPQMKKYTIAQLNKYLDYPADHNIVVHIENKEQHDILSKYCPRMATYSRVYSYYLTADAGYGDAPYYKTIEFNEIDFGEDIIGYTCPEDYGGYQVKGQVFKLAASHTGKWYEWKDENGSIRLPSEIVEKWEPVYKPVFNKVVIGNRNVEVSTYSNGSIHMRGETTTIQLVKALIADFEVESRIVGTNWATHVDPTARFIRIGCVDENNLFSINDLKKVVKAYENLNK